MTDSSMNGTCFVCSTIRLSGYGNPVNRSNPIHGIKFVEFRR